MNRISIHQRNMRCMLDSIKLTEFQNFYAPEKSIQMINTFEKSKKRTVKSRESERNQLGMEVRLNTFKEEEDITMNNSSIR